MQTIIGNNAFLKVYFILRRFTQPYMLFVSRRWKKIARVLPLKKYHHRLWVWHWCLQETNITLCVSSTNKEFFWWKFSKFLDKSRNAFYYFEYHLFATTFIINGQVCIHLLVYFSCKVTGIMYFLSPIRSYSIASSHCQGSRVHMGPWLCRGSYTGYQYTLTWKDDRIVPFCTVGLFV